MSKIEVTRIFYIGKANDVMCTCFKDQCFAIMQSESAYGMYIFFLLLNVSRVSYPRRAWLNDYARKPLLNLGLRVLRVNACVLTTARVHVYEEAYFFLGV